MHLRACVASSTIPVSPATGSTRVRFPEAGRGFDMRLRTWIGIGAIVLIAASGFALLRRPAEPVKSGSNPSATPVTIAAVVPADVPIELDAIGRVQAANTVIVRTQVAGQVQKFAFQEGQPVAAGQLLAQIDSRPFQATVEQDQATLARDRANLANAEADLRRYIPLVGKGLVSAQQVDTQRALVAQLGATIAADQAVLDRDQVQLGYTSITAPIAGIAGLRFVDVGNVVSPADQQGLVVINQVQPIYVLFALPQADLPEIKTRAAASGKDGLTVEAWSQNNSRKLDTGNLAVINNQVDATSGTVTLRGTFPNPGDLLWPGAFVSIRLVLDVQHGGLTIPATALQLGPQGTYVWTVAGDGTAQPTSITVRQSRHGQVLVSSGLSAGEQVVTNGQYGLVPGAHVAAQNAEAQPENAS
ncbi:MAG: efflux transporter periplasmic adaptor subunit, partial [Rhodospirillales bacterium]|nr:efflux transporter periplasmic adaptor subunit [Rhodospirillales bacterium]